MRRRNDGEPAGPARLLSRSDHLRADDRAHEGGLAAAARSQQATPSGTLRSSDWMRRSRRGPLATRGMSIALFPIQGIVRRAHVVRKPRRRTPPIAARNRSGVALAHQRVPGRAAPEPELERPGGSVTVAATSSSSPSRRPAMDARVVVGGARRGGRAREKSERHHHSRPASVARTRTRWPSGVNRAHGGLRSIMRSSSSTPSAARSSAASVTGRPAVRSASMRCTSASCLPPVDPADRAARGR